MRHVQSFIAVVDSGTFTDAATALGVSQAAVSRSISALETALGVRLLQRTTRHVELTAAGHRVVARARRILDEVHHLQQSVEDTDTELRIGYAWSALGRHTRILQRQWAAAHPHVPLVFVHANTPTSGLSEATADIAVIRRPLQDSRFDTALVGVEARYAAVATDSPLARRRSLMLADLARYTVAIECRTGTTTLELWHRESTPVATRVTHGVDEWLTLIAAGQAVGMTSEATVNQHPRPGIAYRVVRNVPPIPVRLAWWRDDPPPRLSELIALIRTSYGRIPQAPPGAPPPAAVREPGEPTPA
ncbi:LysR family transcriptional regulator [Pilimelia anulata]|uniref:LysR family transcriptional regulator n=1 Tax=Pilimelia anulata TaxID=53371 RepID=A0A8J3BEQ0_9ACTN|nr:LysR family transcriptional regulator [Pilimelia anulata]